ncbi:MAG TPA: SPASM domain-containing protein, partial [Thermoanaerobaculia bacterium]|nr:SPASM domain-containing protein [Thermoanaerobaculia bacterium]
VGILREARLPPAVLTNGTGLTPERADALCALGGLRYLSINLSTLDRSRYARDRGGDHLELVLRNLDHLARLPVADEMVIVVLGQGDDVHRRDHEEIAARFAGTRFEVKRFEVMDRAGYLRIGIKPSAPTRRLRGCENTGSRPLQHLHITPRAKAIFCCQDYEEYHVVGDLTTESVAGILAGPELAKLRRWSYGLEEAPADFMCRKCVYALFEG